MNVYIGTLYKEVEYIQSSGTQYIDTGVLASNTKGVYAKFSSQDTTNDSVLFGSRGSSSDSRWLLGTVHWSAPLYYDVMYCGWSYTQDNKSRISTNTIVETELNYKNSRRWSVNGSTLQSSLPSYSYNNYNIYAFGFNSSGTASVMSKIKLYSLKISDGSNLVRDFIPCYRVSDNEIGLFDKVNNKFYTNAGTGTFTKGNDVKTFQAELKNAYIGEYKGWTPGSNTLFYSNWDNGTVTAKVGTITNYGGIIAKQSGTNVLYISGTNVTRIDIPTLYDKGTGNYHYNVWLKVGTSNFTAINYNNGYSQIAITQGTSGTIHAGVVEANLGWGSGYSFNSTIGVFHNVAINYLGGGTCDVYIDGVFKGTSTNTQTGYGNTGSGQWFGVDSSKYSTGNGYVGANIVEDKVRTADEISTYYNQTKSNYGL